MVNSYVFAEVDNGSIRYRTLNFKISIIILLAITNYLLIPYR